MSIRIVLFGASGFVGSAIVSAFQKQGIEVLAVKTPRLPETADWRNGDINQDLAHVREHTVATISGSDVVINAAGVAAPLGSDERQLYAANSVWPAVLASAASIAAVPRFIHISSAAVQGRMVLDDSFNYAAASPYARSKASGEELVMRHGPKGTVIFRPPGVHGRDRSVTHTVAKYARSPFSFVADADAMSPNSLVENVGDAVSYIALKQGIVPTIIVHPFDGLTTEELLARLSGKLPHHVRKEVARVIYRAIILGGRISPALSGVTRRLEVLWFGQQQQTTWLERDGWRPPCGKEHWASLGAALTKRSDSPVFVVFTTVQEQIRVQFEEHRRIWDELGVSIHWVTGRGPMDKRLKDPVHSLPYGRAMNPVDVIRSVFEARRLIRRLRPTLVLYGSPMASVVGSAASFGLVGQRWNVIHGLREETMSGAKKKIAGLGSSVAQRLSTRTICVSESVRKRGVGGDGRRCEVARPGFVGVDPDEIDRRIGLEARKEVRAALGLSDETIVGFVGRIANDKGIRELAFAASKMPSVQFMFVGGFDASDPIPSSTRSILSSSANVHFVGEVEDPYTYYAAMDVLCLPSYREGLSTVIIEAGMAGLPVVASRVTGVVDVLLDSEGWLCDPASHEDLMRALSLALSDFEESRTRAARHKQRMRLMYTQSAVREWWQPKYSRVVR